MFTLKKFFCINRFSYASICGKYKKRHFIERNLHETKDDSFMLFGSETVAAQGREFS
jgi:hypothetical protein